jgi:hypothetical protein
LLELRTAISTLEQLFIDELQVILDYHVLWVLYQKLGNAVLQDLEEEVVLEVHFVANIDYHEDCLHGSQSMLSDIGLN